MAEIQQEYKPVVPKWVGDILKKQKNQDVFASHGRTKEWNEWKDKYSRKLKYTRLNGWTVQEDAQPENKSKGDTNKMTKANPNQTTKVVTNEVRFSYLHVFTPNAVEEGQTPKYSSALLVRKDDTDTMEKFKKAIDAAKVAGVAKFGAKFKQAMDSGNLKMPLRDGDKDRPDQEEYKNHFFVNANSTNKPGVVDANVQPILDSTEIYSGCYGRASVNFYAYDRNGNRGIACGLNNIQKTRDGETLGGRSRAEDDFDAVETGSSDGGGYDDLLS